MCLEQEHKLRSKNTNPEIKKKKKTKNTIPDTRKKEKNTHIHTFFPTLKLTQKNNT